MKRRGGGGGGGGARDPRAVETANVATEYRTTYKNDF